MNKELVYEAALRGIASCATECGCCKMHVRVALSVLATNGDTPPDHKHNSTRETTYPDNTCDLSPLGAALLGRTCEDCES